jgi:hypothetical protein
MEKKRSKSKIVACSMLSFNSLLFKIKFINKTKLLL